MQRKTTGATGEKMHHIEYEGLVCPVVGGDTRKSVKDETQILKPPRHAHLWVFISIGGNSITIMSISKLLIRKANAELFAGFRKVMNVDYGSITEIRVVW